MNLSNGFHLIGRIGNDLAIETTSKGKKMLKISLATTDRVFDKGSQQFVNKTKWFNLVLWENKAESLIKLLKKGMRVGVSGYMEEVPTLIGEKKITQIRLNVENVEPFFDLGAGKKDDEVAD